MATFNRERFKAEHPGVTDDQIDAYLASPQAKVDAQATAPVPPPVAAAGGGNPLAEPVGAAMQFLGGAKSLGIPLSVGAGLYGLNRLRAGSGGHSLVKLTRADLKAHPEFRSFKVGEKISRSNYEAVKMAAGTQAPPPVAAAAEATAAPPPRDVVSQEMIDRYNIFRGFKPGDTLPAGQAAEAMAASRPAGKPNLSAVPPAMLEATVTPEQMSAPQASPPPAPSRHDVQYYSESAGKFVPIEDMHISQLRNAVNKLGRKRAESNRPSPVTRKQFEALKNEITYRAQQAGELSVPPENANTVRQFNARRGTMFEPNPTPGLSLGGAVGGLNEAAMLLALLNGPQQLQQMQEAQNIFNQSNIQHSPLHRALIQALLQGNAPRGI